MASQLKAPDPKIVHYNLRRILGAEISDPKNVFILDIETTDVEPLSGVIWQIGYYSVVNGVPDTDAPEGSNIWLKQPAGVLKQATYEISRRRAVRRKEPHDRGATIVRDKDYIEAEDEFISEVQSRGVDPRDAIAAITDMVNGATASRCIIAGHNAIRFDCRWLEIYANYYSLPEIIFPSDWVLDTGMLIKAGILGRRILSRESYREFYASVAEIRAKGVYYALDRFCMEFFSLAEKYGVDVTKAHNAGFDTFVTWLVIRELVEMARGAEWET